MTARFQRGEIVLVRFPFTDLSGSKRRPAIILAAYPPDIVVAFISSVVPDEPEPSDILLQPTPDNGLKKVSIMRLRKIATLEQELVTRRLGKLDQGLLTAVDTALLHGLGIDVLRREYQRLAALLEDEGVTAVVEHIHAMTNRETEQP